MSLIIGPNQHGSLKCQIDTGAGGNVMPLCVFVKLLPKCISTDDKPFSLHPTNTHLTGYNGSTIFQLGGLDTAIKRKPKDHHLSD